MAIPKNFKTAAEVAKDLPPSRRGRPVHAQTVAGWMKSGKLKGWKFPSGWMTTDEAVAEFIDRLTRDALGEPAAVPPAVEAPSRSHQRAEAELQAAGI